MDKEDAALQWLQRSVAWMGQVLAVSVLYATAVAAAECPQAPERPTLPADANVDQTGWQGLADPYSVVHWSGGYDYAPLGIGHLVVENRQDAYYDWAGRVRLPVWYAPNGDFYAWVHGGQVHPLNETGAYPLTGAGMVETDYEHLTLIVWQSTPDGWLQIRLAASAAGTVWTHRCHLEAGGIRLAYQSWEDFIREHGDWLHFRAQVPHALREQPDISSARITWIGLDHELTLLAMQGDWLRVRVRQPAWTCAGPDREFQGTVHEGWVKWRDEQTGPWVWIYSRGC